jgi:dCTP deaminase
VLTPSFDETGVLPNHQLREAMVDGYIKGGGYEIPDENIQPASLDLRLGDKAYRMRCSFLPGRQAVLEKAKGYVIDEVSLRGEGAVLETKRPYLIPLKEELQLPANLRGKANPKSSTGRSDVFTRLITDRSDRFDEIAPGYSGKLYLEVVPLSFPIRVRENLCLNQLRLSIGRATLSDDEIRAFHEEQTPLLYLNGRPVPTEKLSLSDGMFLTLDLAGDTQRRVGYKARDNAPLLDLAKIGAFSADDYWEYARREDGGERLILGSAEFYLLMSNEAVVIPPTLAAEMTAYDPTSGELRTHYAGFFDPGFGFDPDGHFHGSRAALEVRAHDVPFLIENDQRVCKLTFERMLDIPSMLYGQGIGSSYQRQESTLGKHFFTGPEVEQTVARATFQPHLGAARLFEEPSED